MYGRSAGFFSIFFIYSLFHLPYEFGMALPSAANSSSFDCTLGPFGHGLRMHVKRFRRDMAIDSLTLSPSGVY